VANLNPVHDSLEWQHCERSGDVILGWVNWTAMAFGFPIARESRFYEPTDGLRTVSPITADVAGACQ